MLLATLAVVIGYATLPIWMGSTRLVVPTADYWISLIPRREVNHVRIEFLQEEIVIGAMLFQNEADSPIRGGNSLREFESPGKVSWLELDAKGKKFRRADVQVSASKVAITKVAIDGATVDLAEAMIMFNSPQVHPTLVTSLRWTDKLTKQVTDFNPILGDLTLGIMAVLALYVGALALDSGRRYFLGKTSMSTSGSGGEASSAKAVRAFMELQLRTERRVRLAQIAQTLGPAFGLLLTVSSLVEALSPSVTETRDLGRYFSAIHLALVSTFVGLTIRILAIVIEQCESSQLMLALHQADSALAAMSQGEELGQREGQVASSGASSTSVSPVVESSDPAIHATEDENHSS